MPSAVQKQSFFSGPLAPDDTQKSNTINIMAPLQGYAVNKSTNPERPAISETPMESIMNSLVRSLDQLDSELGALLARIQPIIATNPSVTKEEARGIYMGNSGMSQFIANAANRINGFRDAVGAANANLEL
jgi:hypothetical protein